MWNWEYLTWAFTTAAIIGGIIALPGERLNATTKENVATWLMAGSNRQWAEKFNTLFDWVMGPKHVSLRRMISSAIATGLAVGMLYILMEPVLGLISARTDAQIGWLEILVFAAVINLVADYISLIETRWLLGRFAHWQNWFAQVALLVLDLIISATIIFAAITLFRLIRGDDLLTPMEVIAGYTPFAIFFYSTFLTSIWAWGFCLSAWTIRLFSGLRLYRLFDVAEKPFANLGMIAGVVAFAGLMAGKPVTEAALPEDVDHWLCLKFEGKICTHAARLSGDDVAQLERLKLACTTGDPTQCQGILNGFEKRMVAEAVPYLEAACWDGRDGAACNTLGYMNDEAINLPQNYRAAKLFYERGCDAGNMGACNNLGYLHQHGRGVPKDYEKAMALYEQACDPRDPSTCNNLGYMFQHGLGIPQDFAKARGLYGPACDAGNMSACNNLAFMYRNGLGIPQDLEKAKALYETACDGGNLSACYNLGYMYDEGLGIPQDFEKAKALYEAACDDGNMGACNNLAYLHRHGLGIPQDFEKAKALYETACDAENAGACNNLGYMYDEGLGVERDIEAARDIFNKACTLGSKNSCAAVQRLTRELGE